MPAPMPPIKRRPDHPYPTQGAKVKTEQKLGLLALVIIAIIIDLIFRVGWYVGQHLHWSWA